MALPMLVAMVIKNVLLAKTKYIEIGIVLEIPALTRLLTIEQTNPAVQPATTAIPAPQTPVHQGVVFILL